jgi:hypothetical protein
MRTTIVHAVCLAAFIVTALPDAASAQPPLERGTWLVTPAIGLALDSDADPSLAVSGGLAYPITSFFAVEGELAHVFDMAPDDADVDSALTTVHGSLLYFFRTPYFLTPYVAAGLGVGKFSHEVRNPPASISGTELGFNLGGGITHPLSSATWFRGDVRYFKHIDDVPTVWRFSAGITIRLGP